VNLNLDRTPLTTEQLQSLAVDALTSKEVTRADALAKVSDMGAVLHNPNLLRSWLLDTTKELRFAMFARGELVLDTSEPFVPKPERPWVIDPFFLAQKAATMA
jgi:hypothetical protein